MRLAQQGKLWTSVLAVLVVLVSSFVLVNSLLNAPPRVRFRRNAAEKAQLNALAAALELVQNEFQTYPPSEANDPTGRPYCGAMKLAEALIGRDQRGIHARSAYRVDGLDPNGLKPLYPPKPDTANLQLRKGPFVMVKNANACRLVDIYGKGNTGPFPEDTLVLCDCYRRARPGGAKTGMPILYYRADPLGTTHDVNHPDNPRNIYHYQDNQALVLLGKPDKPGGVHALADAKRFYQNTENPKSRATSEPYRRDSFILISAGWDGEYGDADDICNFEWKYHER
jgi:type II secretory pathway pseudopilin PulG